ncbi:MAG TPA: hypothetical protein VFG14_06740, partial [Chthoniobacteraceae bacterium]|nr:hypothetical protein [Chthoniobacteraceae bacterium]
TKFKDYQFGLKLISQNTGQLEFTIDSPVVTDSDKTLSDWVVASYRNTLNKESASAAAETAPSVEAPAPGPEQKAQTNQ